MNVTTKQVLKYTLLPGIMPRMRELVGGGAGYIALYLAQIYAAVRLLPPGHPYLNPANKGRFGAHNVVVAAAGRLKFKKENCDQIIIFFLMLVGLIIFVMQFFLLGIALFMQAAHATSIPAGLPNSFAGFFITPSPGDDDIAFVLLDRVFGVPQLFLDSGGGGSCVEKGTSCFAFINSSAQPEGNYPWPFHIALRAMMQFYSIGLLIIGLLIFLYFTVTVVMETAQDGIAFGRRFNHVWAPIRMVVALGLLIPVANGLNAAQYITLYAAYWGSGFATNGWNLFIQKAIPGANDTPGGPLTTMVVTPNQPEMTNLTQFYTVAATCYAAYWQMISDQGETIGGTYNSGLDIEGYLVKPGGDTANHKRLPYAGDPMGDGSASLDFATALNFMEYHDIDIVYGSCTAHDAAGVTQDCDNCPGCKPDYPEEKGNVKPLCGEVVIPLEGSLDPSVTANPDPGAYYITQQWWELTYASWLGSAANNGPCHAADLGGRSCWGTAGTATDSTCPTGTTMSGVSDVFSIYEQWGYCFVNKYGYDPVNASTPVPSNADLRWLSDSDPNNLGQFQQKLATIIQNAVALSVLTTQWKYIEGRLGWAGAGLWYHNVARINGSMVSALADIPFVVKYPSVMEDIKKSKANSDKNSSGAEIYRPVAATDQHPEGTKTDSQGDKLAETFWQAYSAWNNATTVKPTGSWFVDIITAVEGTSGLTALTDPKNINVHPMALLVGIGKSLSQNSLIALGTFTGGALVIRAMGLNNVQKATASFFSFVFSLCIMGFTVGALLYYIVPFMPFLYYFFAVATWIKGIFEAMVGVPLWALAHIHIDGDGLPGQYAMGGYLMIMEIFLRPILIVFGLLASVVFFAAQVRVLHDIWGLVTSNLTGFDTTASVVMPAGDTHSLTFYRDAVDQFFFTVIYAVVVYMLGMSSFKLITLIPAKVMRWIGTSVETFDDGGSQMAEHFKGSMTSGLGGITTQIGQNLQHLAKDPMPEGTSPVGGLVGKII